MKIDFRKHLTCVAWIVVMVVVQACTVDEDGVPVRLKDHEYMPLAVGVYQIYNVTETEYVNGPTGETQRYELMMEVVDSTSYVNGYYQYIIHRKTRQNADEPWIPKDTWAATFTDREAVVQEGNISFVKLVLPVSANRIWNGNLYNSLGAEEYSISLFAQPMQVGVQNFTDVVEVTHSNETDAIIGNDVRKELYARGVGLIRRSEEVVTYCSNTPNCIGEQIIQQGVVLEQVLIEYGKK